MARLKIAGINGTIPIDRGLPGGIGGVGGDTALSGMQIKPRVKIGSAPNADGFIITQKGSRKFRVSDGTNIGTCTLVDKDNASLGENEMSITATKSDTTTFRVARISNKFVIDFNGIKYRYWLLPANSTYVSVASA